MPSTNSTLTLATVASLTLLAACDSSTGGAAGDSDDVTDAVTLLAPFTGIYRILGNWQGSEADEAYLDIQTPGADGTAPVDFQDFDETDNCLITPASSGTVRKDDFSDRVFMDDLFQFDEAELTQTATSLTIEFNDDLDLDGDGSTQDRISIMATRQGVAQLSDIAADC